MTDPNPTHMLRYCTTIVPDVLAKACGVDGDLAERIGVDILDRAEAFAAMPADQRRVLIAPFLEEAFHHWPLAASVEGRANVVLVVRNSLLEQAHHQGPLTSWIIPIAEHAVGPLSHLIAARDRHPIEPRGVNPFTGLAGRYPRAWACFTVLAEAFTDRGRHPLRLPAAPIPDLPHGDDFATEPRRAWTMPRRSSVPSTRVTTSI